MTEPMHLNNRHRDTVAKILQHPASHNVEWHAVLSLLQYIGQVDERHDGRFEVTIGGETEIFDKPSTRTSTNSRLSTCAACSGRRTSPSTSVTKTSAARRNQVSRGRRRSASDPVDQRQGDRPGEHARPGPLPIAAEHQHPGFVGTVGDHIHDFAVRHLGDDGSGARACRGGAQFAELAGLQFPPCGPTVPSAAAGESRAPCAVDRAFVPLPSRSAVAQACAVKRHLVSVSGVWSWQDHLAGH
jgi:hypothetical protein